MSIHSVESINKLNPRFKMSTNSIESLIYKKQYVNLPTKLLDKVRELFGPTLASAWEVFYTESRRTHGVLKKTYDYLARKIGCSRRTVIRYAKRLSESGLLIINHMFHHSCNIENEFILLTPEEALIAANDAPNREKPVLDIDYSVNYLVENSNSVDKSVTICHPSITDLNQDNNTTEAAPIIALRQEDKPRCLPKKVNGIHSEPQCIPKSVSKKVIRYLEKFIKGQKWVSNPSQLLEEAIYFVATRKEGYSEWQAAGAFKKLLGYEGNGSWRTPLGVIYDNAIIRNIKNIWTSRGRVYSLY